MIAVSYSYSDRVLFLLRARVLLQRLLMLLPRSADCGNFTCTEDVSSRMRAPDDSTPEVSVAVASRAMRIAIGLGETAINHFSPGTELSPRWRRCDAGGYGAGHRQRRRRQRPGGDGKVVSWSLIQRPQLAVVGINQQHHFDFRVAYPIIRAGLT